MSEVEDSTITVQSADASATPDPSALRRKHRPGLRRVQIACERCRSRKNRVRCFEPKETTTQLTSGKCDRKVPTCSTCEAAGVPCVVIDRLTNRQYNRGHLEELEAEVDSLNARIKQLEHDKSTLKQRLDGLTINNESPIDPALGDENLSNLAHSSSDKHSVSQNLDVVTRDISSSQRYVGDSSGLFFGDVVKGFLLEADYKRDHGPTRNSLRLRVGDRLASPSTPSNIASPQPSLENIFPDFDLAIKLQTAFFTHRWPALPSIHRPSFTNGHFSAVMTLKHQASHVSLFLVFMVFALGAIDIKRQEPRFEDRRLDYFNLATRDYLHELLKQDDIETVQGLILVAQFSVNEYRSANAWYVAGQAVRTAVDLGLHRGSSFSSSSPRDMLGVEMRRRVFWSAYALDRNISISLGRPCALSDADIDAELPQNLADDDLVGDFIQLGPQQRPKFNASDMSTFIHIVKLRQLQSKIQSSFYPAQMSAIVAHDIESQRSFLRHQLDEWVSQAPRYSHPTVATFQSTEWFQIAYSHALLLLYRPSPASPVIQLDCLQFCADAAISLISSYSSLYAKNKVTYTWIALHSLFMASVTMLYTLWVSPEIRASTTKAVVKSNVTSCLALFEIMSEYWPLATRCHDIIDRLGNIAVEVFDSPRSGSRAPENHQGLPNLSSRQDNTHFDAIHSEFMDWFETRGNHVHSSTTSLMASTEHAIPAAETSNTEANEPMQPSADEVEMSLVTMDDLFGHEFDTTLPMMMTAFGNGPY